MRTVQEHPVAALTAAATSALAATGDPIQFIESHPVTAAAAVAAYGVYSCTTCAMQKQENEHELKKREQEHDYTLKRNYIDTHKDAVLISQQQDETDVPFVLRTTQQRKTYVGTPWQAKDANTAANCIENG